MRVWLCVVIPDLEYMRSKKTIIVGGKVLIVHDGSDSISNLNGRDLYCKEKMTMTMDNNNEKEKTIEWPACVVSN